jgi:D-sedoheptulose 7-phosphate isomerase
LTLQRTFRPDNDPRASSGPAAGANLPDSDHLARFQGLYADHAEVFERSRALLAPAAELAGAVISTLRAGGKLLLCGNGGSAADSQHLAAEFAIRFEKKRRALPAIALTTDTSALTAAGNDFGFEQVFARQVEALGRRGDLLIALSTSGTSPNILAALRAARAAGMVTACLTGRDGGTVASERLADHCLVVPAEETARIQEIHIFLGHLICAAADGAFAQG